MASALTTSKHKTLELAEAKRNKGVAYLVTKLIERGCNDIKISPHGLLNNGIQVVCNGNDTVATYDICTLYEKPILRVYTFDCLDEYLLD
jgi:hypothetical protein